MAKKHLSPYEMVGYYQTALFLYNNTKDEELKKACKKIIDKVHKLLKMFYETVGGKSGN